METKKVRILALHGLHLREAARIVTIARKFSSRIELVHNFATANTHSILDVVSLGIPQNSEVTLVIEGPDEKAAMKELSQTFQDGEGI